MITLRLLTIFAIGVFTSLANAQTGSSVTPIILLLLLDDEEVPNPNGVDRLGLRAIQGQDISEDGLVDSTTSNTYDNSGRLILRIQRTLDEEGNAVRIDTSRFEYDSFGRASAATMVSTNPSGEIISSSDFDLIYVGEDFNSGSFTLDKYVVTSSSGDGTNELIQDFQYLGIDGLGLPRVSRVISTLTSSALPSVTTSTDVPTYSVSDENIISIQRTTTGDISFEETSILGYNGSEQTSVIRTGSGFSGNVRIDTREERNLSFTSGIQEITRDNGNVRFRTITEYENGICDTTNEVNQRLLGLFSISTLGNSLGRVCR